MTNLSAAPSNKSLILGTALWGWGLDRKTAHKIVDNFVSAGGEIIDTASNYPINKKSEDFGLAAKWISEWLATNGENSVSILMKIGAANNNGDALVNLDKTFILETADQFQAKFGSALSAISIHWDNRGDLDSDITEIAQTVTAFETLHASGMSIGLSGIRHPKLYLDAGPLLADKWWIQVKENLLTCHARLHYQTAFPHAKYLAYGINMGGIKFEPPSETSSTSLRNIQRPDGIVKIVSDFLQSEHGLCPAPSSINHLALTTSYFNSSLSGVIIGPRSVEQFEDSMLFWKKLKERSSSETPKSLELLIASVNSKNARSSTSAT